MSQETTTSRRAKRIERQKNRPTLVMPTTSESKVEEPPINTQVAVETEIQTVPARKRPGFFASIGKQRDEKEVTDEAVQNARLARAARNKKSAVETDAKAVVAKAETEEKVVKPNVQRAAANRPQTGWKSRYIWGMLIYIFVAQVVAYATQYLAVLYKWDEKPLIANLFGVNGFNLTVSTAIFLAALIITLFLLARFDLLPRGFRNQAARNVTANNKRDSNMNRSVGERKIPPVVRPGVQGEHDNLYREYRLNQRKKK